MLSPGHPRWQGHLSDPSGRHGRRASLVRQLQSVSRSAAGTRAQRDRAIRRAWQAPTSARRLSRRTDRPRERRGRSCGASLPAKPACRLAGSARLERQLLGFARAGDGQRARCRRPGAGPGADGDRWCRARRRHRDEHPSSIRAFGVGDQSDPGRRTRYHGDTGLLGRSRRIARPTPVAVPNVVGQPQATASANIGTATLVVGTVTTANHPTVPAGNVISQNPTAGTMVLPNSAVNLVVSTGPVMVAVPNVVSSSESSAVASLQAAHLAVGVSYAADPMVPAGDVISQKPCRRHERGRRLCRRHRRVHRTGGGDRAQCGGPASSHGDVRHPDRDVGRRERHDGIQSVGGHWIRDQSKPDWRSKRGTGIGSESGGLPRSCSGRAGLARGAAQFERRGLGLAGRSRVERARWSRRDDLAVAACDVPAALPVLAQREPSRR